MKIKDYISQKAEEYGNLDLFQAFANDRIPLEQFPAFFKEQYMTARWFQDLIWATTEIHDGPYTAFAQKHRKVDSGHHRMMKYDLKSFGLEPMTDEDWFRLEWLPTRMQMARILAMCYKASPEKLLIILSCMESAGDVTLGTLFGYVERHGLIDKTQYLGKTHIEIEQKQVADIYHAAPELMDSTGEEYIPVIDTVFDALTTMFSEGGKRYYNEFIYEQQHAEQ
jgi:hypothetical protein